MISDGASWIANWIGRLKWSRIAHILCWYHLCKRVTEGLSGLGVPKEERQIWQKKILGHLWKGETAKAIEILNGLILHCRVPSRLKELVEDLKRKESWIVNYQLRHEQRLWIASTKVEKWNDNAVSARCKKNGMAWKEKGVFAIAIKNAKKFIKYCKYKDNILHTKS